MSYFDKSKGRWRGRVKYKGHTSSQLFDRKKDADEWEYHEKKILKKEVDSPQPPNSLLEICAAWALLSKPPRASQKTYDEKTLFSTRLVKFFGPKTPITDLTKTDLLEYLEHVLETRTVPAHNKDRKNLHGLFNHAIEYHGYIGNPVKNIPKIAQEKIHQPVATEEEVMRLLLACNRVEHVFMTTFIHTAARRAEIFRLQWNEDINFEERAIQLCNRKSRSKELTCNWVDMSPELYDELWWWFNNQPIKNHPFVFYSIEDGRHYGQPFKYRQRFMQKLCERAGIRKLGFHSLRRFVASYLSDKQKQSTKAIQDLLRHKEIATTDRYIKRIHTSMKETVGSLGGLSAHPKEAKDDLKKVSGSPETDALENPKIDSEKVKIFPREPQTGAPKK